MGWHEELCENCWMEHLDKSSSSEHMKAFDDAHLILLPGHHGRERELFGEGELLQGGAVEGEAGNNVAVLHNTRDLNNIFDIEIKNKEELFESIDYIKKGTKGIVKFSYHQSILKRTYIL